MLSSFLSVLPILIPREKPFKKIQEKKNSLETFGFLNPFEHVSFRLLSWAGTRCRAVNRQSPSFERTIQTQSVFFSPLVRTETPPPQVNSEDTEY
jgi:hypothetical protein